MAGFVEVAALKFDAVILPARCKNHDLLADCPRVICSRFFAWSGETCLQIEKMHTPYVV